MNYFSIPNKQKCAFLKLTHFVQIKEGTLTHWHFTKWC